MVDRKQNMEEIKEEKSVVDLEEIQNMFSGNKTWKNEEEMLMELAEFRRLRG